MKRSVIIITLIILSFLPFNENMISAQEKMTRVDVPLNVRCIRKNPTSLVLRWNRDKNVDGYIVYRFNKNANAYKKIKKINKSKNSFVDNHRETNKIYKYKMVAYKKVGTKTVYSPQSIVVSAMPYKRNDRVINGRKPELSKKKVFMSFHSSKKIRAKVRASRYGLNKNKRPCSKEVRWYSGNKKIATVDKNGVITAGSSAGKCCIYAVAHNGKKSKVFVTVKNYARPKTFYNYGEQDDVYSLLNDYKNEIEDIAEYYCIHRPAKKEKINFYLEKNAKVSVTPQNINYDRIADKINELLVNYPYDIEIEVRSEYLMYIIRNEQFPLPAYVLFSFDESGSKTPELQIASHWIMWRPIAV